MHDYLVDSMLLVYCDSELGEWRKLGRDACFYRRRWRIVPCSTIFARVTRTRRRGRGQIANAALVIWVDERRYNAIMITRASVAPLLRTEYASAVAAAFAICPAESL